MKALSLTVLIGMTTLMACSPFGNPPSGLPSPQISSPGDVTPTIDPTWTPSSGMPYPNITATPGAEDLRSKTEADIQERRESLDIRQVKVNADRSKILYVYQKSLELDFKNWYRNPARKWIESGLWTYDRQTQQHKEILPNPNNYSDNRFYNARWLNNQEIVYADSDAKKLLAHDAVSGQIKTLFESDNISQFQVYQHYLFILHSKQNKLRLLRVDLNTQQSLENEVPYSDFYMSTQFGVITQDQVLLGQFKEFYKEGQYPFKVATTTPPPIQDSFLMNLTDGKVQSVQNGLDLDTYNSIQISPNQSYFATQRGSHSQIYTLLGKLVLETEGEFNWIDDTHILIQNGREMTRYELKAEQSQQIERFSTQTECDNVQGSEPTLMQCPVKGFYQNNTDSISRVFRLTPTLELESTQKQEPLIDERRNASLLPAESDQPIRIIENLTGKEGFSSISILDDQGKMWVLMKLENPDNPSFQFDPKDYMWWTS